MKYLAIGKYNIAFCMDVHELANALAHRCVPECRVYASEAWEELRNMAQIGQQRILDNSTNADALPPMALPTAVTASISLTYAENVALPIAASNVGEIGEWGISGLNGFCTASTVEMLCQLLAGGEMVYPIAQWFPSHPDAVVAARNHYTRRFYSRYRVSSETTFLPHKCLEFFKDSFFDERERRRAAQIEALRQWHLLCWERGWM